MPACYDGTLPDPRRRTYAARGNVPSNPRVCHRAEHPLGLKPGGQ
jgi:hypothetical protein